MAAVVVELDSIAPARVAEAARYDVENRRSDAWSFYMLGADFKSDSQIRPEQGEAICEGITDRARYRQEHAEALREAMRADLGLDTLGEDEGF